MDLKPRHFRAAHKEALVSCICDKNLPRTKRCTKSGWIRCQGTAQANWKLLDKLVEIEDRKKE